MVIVLLTTDVAVLASCVVLLLSQCFLSSWPELFKRWITLSTGQITIQWISVNKKKTRYALDSDLSGR